MHYISSILKMFSQMFYLAFCIVVVWNISQKAMFHITWDNFGSCVYIPFVIWALHTPPPPPHACVNGQVLCYYLIKFFWENIVSLPEIYWFQWDRNWFDSSANIMGSYCFNLWYYYQINYRINFKLYYHFA